MTESPAPYLPMPFYSAWLAGGRNQASSAFCFALHRHSRASIPSGVDLCFQMNGPPSWASRVLLLLFLCGSVGSKLFVKPRPVGKGCLRFS